MILNLSANYSKCIVACMMIYVNSAEPSRPTSWYPLLIGIIIDHYGSSGLADALLAVKTRGEIVKRKTLRHAICKWSHHSKTKETLRYFPPILKFTCCLITSINVLKRFIALFHSCLPGNKLKDVMSRIILDECENGVCQTSSTSYHNSIIYWQSLQYYLAKV